MKVFTVVIRNVTDKLSKCKRRHCESEEFWAGPLFLGVVELVLLLWVASGSAGLVVFWILMVFRR
jgi:hypothetical protein